jgi:2-enoate reductase
LSKELKKDKIIEDLSDYYADWFKDDKVLEKGKMTSNLYPYENIFSPIRVNRITIKNRLVMAPMGNISMCEETGRPNDKMLAYFTERAKGGVGLITTGLIPISHGLDNSITEMGQLSYFPRIDRSRTVFSGWRDLSASVHSYGARIFIQLTAGLGRVGNPQCLVNELKFPQSASMNPSWYMPELPCLPMSDHKLNKIIKNFGQATADARAMNIDGVYLHGHEGYLLEQLTNPAFNRRKLGKFAKWQAFGIETVKEMRKRVGPNYPIMYRIDLSLALNETYKDRMFEVPSLKKFTNGRTIKDTLDYMKNLVKAGVDMFDVDLGCYDNWWLPHPPGSMPPGCFLDISKIAKEYFEQNNILSNQGIPVPIVAVGKLGYPDLAEQALRDDKCDMIMLGRPLLADPEWPNKVRTGRVDEICPCIGCQEGCLNEFVEGGHPQCAINPRTAFEEVYSKDPPKAAKPCKIAVIGAGPAGITTAVVAAQRGHSVTLFDKRNELGGRLIAGSAAKIKFDLANYVKYLNGYVDRAAKEYDLTVKLGTEATPDMLGDFDKIVVAAGTSDTVLRLPGIEKANWKQAVDVLVNPKLVDGCKNVVVIGGGVVGAEVAYFLNKECGINDITVVEMDKYIMNHACTANRGHLLKCMYDAGIKLWNCTSLKSFEPNGVNVRRNKSDTVPNPYLSWNPILPESVPNPLAKKIKDESVDEFVPADMVIMAAGGRPNEALFLELQDKFNTKEVYNLGDSFKGGKIFEATKSGYALALNL